jgi:hypothetical protein
MYDYFRKTVKITYFMVGKGKKGKAIPVPGQGGP